MFVCVWGGGGGGYSHFFFIRRIGPSIYRLPQKKIGNIKRPKKYLKYFCHAKISSFCSFSLRKDPQYIEKTPKTSPICRDPKKYPQNLHTPKIFIFLKPPKNNVIQKFKQKRKTRAYACIKQYQSTPLVDRDCFVAVN